jgi:hypothetical protein
LDQKHSLLQHIHVFISQEQVPLRTDDRWILASRELTKQAQGHAMMSLRRSEGITHTAEVNRLSLPQEFVHN